MTEIPAPRPSPFAVFRHADFRRYALARLVTIFSGQMLATTIGWQVYEITRDPLMLGMVGLTQFVPNMLFSLVSGTVADRHDRRRIVMTCIASSFLCASALAWTSWGGNPSLAAIFGVSFCFGVIRAFSAPANSSFLTAVIPPAEFPSGVLWQQIGFQVGSIVGPSTAGVVLATSAGAPAVYGTCLVLYVVALASFATMRVRPEPRPAAEPFSAALLGGLRYVFRERLLLGAMSLDLFAVLLGGATALLPVFAKDVLRTDSTGLGILRAAPSVGAGLAAFVLAFRPLSRRIGPWLLGGVASFGAATVVFGLSENLWLSAAALAVSGAADMISVTVRHTLIQVATPDEVRGRVSAVAFIFIGASNELGEFESGVTAKWWGAARAVVVGGAGTIAVVLAWCGLFPQLRKADRFEDYRAAGAR
jgi:MFS family permease